MSLQVTLRRAESIRLSLTSVLSALSIALSFIQIPFPLAPFLKYDLAGIPLILTALLIGPRYALIADTVLALALMRGGDPIGAAMKWIAEASTFIPMYYAYKLLRGNGNLRLAFTASAAVGIAARVGLMVLANYLVDPWWFLIAHWVNTYSKALALTMYLLPFIALFNLTIALIYTSITYPAYLTIARRFRWLVDADGE
jgi:riboflavin transporter FmnP